MTLSQHQSPSLFAPAVWSLGLLASLWLGACSEPKEEACVVHTQPDGRQVIRCPDGSSGTFVPPEFPAAPAAVRGNVRRLGENDNSGIEVTLSPARAEGELRRSFTDAEGNFAFDDVEPGTYHISLQYPAYPKVDLWQQTVLPGTLVLDPVVLRPTTRIAETTPEKLVVSPNDDALLIVESVAGGRLFYWDEATGEQAQLIGTKTTQARWLPSGRVLFLENYNPASNSGMLVLFDPSRDTSEVLLRDVIEWAVSDDETVAVARQTQNALSVWKATDRSVDVIVGSGLISWAFHPGSKLVAAVFQGAHTGGPEALVWDTVARQASMLGPISGDGVAFDPQGRFLLYRATFGLALWDHARRQPRVLAPSSMRLVEFGPKGAFVALHDLTGGIHLYEPESVQPRTVSTGAVQSGFDPRTGAFWLFHDEPRRLVLVPPGRDPIELHRWTETVFPMQVLFPRGREEILYVVRTSSVVRELWLWSPAKGSVLIDSGLTTDALLVGDETYVLYQTTRPRLLDLSSGELVDLRKDGNLHYPVGHHEEGLLHYPIAPLYRATPPNTVGAMAIRDLATGAEHVVVDELWHESCAFSPAAELFCLNRRSSSIPWGAELVRWNRDASLLHRLADGVLEFRFDREGGRAIYYSQARRDEMAPMLWLWERDLATPVAIDDGVGLAVLTSRWVAYHVEDRSREGVHVSVYPRIAPWFAP